MKSTQAKFLVPGVKDTGRTKGAHSKWIDILHNPHLEKLCYARPLKPRRNIYIYCCFLVFTMQRKLDWGNDQRNLPITKYLLTPLRSRRVANLFATTTAAMTVGNQNFSGAQLYHILENEDIHI